MAWFKVDDGFYSHPKVLSIPRAIRAEALGTWILCGTWCADKLTDGRIPAHMVEELGGTIEGAEALVTVRLYRRVRSAYQVINWSEFQFTRAQVEANQKSERERKAEYRARKALEHAERPADVPTGQTRIPNTPSPSRPVPDLPTGVDNARPVPETAGEPVDRTGESSSTVRYEERAAAFGVDFEKVRRAIAKRSGDLSIPPSAVFAGIVTIVDRAKKRRGDRTGLILHSLDDDWAEWQRLIEDAA